MQHETINHGSAIASLADFGNWLFTRACVPGEVFICAVDALQYKTSEYQLPLTMKVEVLYILHIHKYILFIFPDFVLYFLIFLS